jgi:hypothetical protein
MMNAVYRDAQREYAMKLTGDLLEQAQVPHILLKGSVLCRLYPQSWMRTSCDIDILIRPSDAQTVEKVLCGANYIRAEDCTLHDYSYFSPNKIHIEMHHTLKQEGNFSNPNHVLEAVWDEYAVAEEGCGFRYRMTPELFVFYHVAHMGKHLIYGGCGIRPFVDLWLLRKKMTVDAVALRDMLVRSKLSQLYDISAALSEVWLEDRPHTEQTKMLEEYIFSGGIYGTTENAAKVKAARGVSRKRAFFDLMFLPRENLEILYPKLKERPGLYPFYQVKRWFGYLDQNRRNKIHHLTAQRNQVRDGERDATAELLRQLGLI